MKKLLAVFLMAALMAGLLTGCQRIIWNGQWDEKEMRGFWEENASADKNTSMTVYSLPDEEELGKLSGETLDQFLDDSNSSPWEMADLPEDAVPSLRFEFEQKATRHWGERPEDVKRLHVFDLTVYDQPYVRMNICILGDFQLDFQVTEDVRDFLLTGWKS